MRELQSVLGIDYGSKMAGTTVVAYEQNNIVKLYCSDKKKDADKMILELCSSLNPKLVALDAPLSLPGVYRGLDGCSDYFYRDCDRELKAMSPMFLGGLTARAMKLSAMLTAQNTQVIETYPVHTGKQMGLIDHGYRSKTPDLAAILSRLQKEMGWRFDTGTQEITGHHIDAILALITGHRFYANEAKRVGNSKEGFIHY